MGVMKARFYKIINGQELLLLMLPYFAVFISAFLVGTRCYEPKFADDTGLEKYEDPLLSDYVVAV